MYRCGIVVHNLRKTCEEIVGIFVQKQSIGMTQHSLCGTTFFIHILMHGLSTPQSTILSCLQQIDTRCFPQFPQLLLLLPNLKKRNL